LPSQSVEISRIFNDIIRLFHSGLGGNLSPKHGFNLISWHLVTTHDTLDLEDSRGIYDQNPIYQAPIPRFKEQGNLQDDIGIIARISTAQHFSLDEGMQKSLDPLSCLRIGKNNFPKTAPIQLAIRQNLLAKMRHELCKRISPRLNDGSCDLIRINHWHTQSTEYR
jgi:hypothetical protein